MLTTTNQKTKALFSHLVLSWRNCQKCPLHKFRSTVVHARGTMPADVLYIGEAPGPVEDTLGEPFIGPAGKLFDLIIAEVPEHTYCIINGVACIPCDTKEKEFRSPSETERAACRPRLLDLVKLVKPTQVVCLGKSAEMAYRELGRWVDPLPPVLNLPHPSALLRRNAGPGHSDFERCVLQLTEFIQ